MAARNNSTETETGAEVPQTGRRRGRQNNAEIPAKIDGNPEDDAASREAADDVERGETTPRSEARIFRVTQGPRPLYICAIAIGNVNNQFFTENFGGGKYVAKCFVPKKSAKGGITLVYDRTMNIEIDATVPRKTPPWLVDEAPPAAAAAAGDADDDRGNGRRRSPRLDAMMDSEVESILDSSRRAREQSDAMHSSTMAMLTNTMAAMAKATRDMMDAKPGDAGAAAPMDPMELMDKLEERLERRREKSADPLDRMMRTMELRMLMREMGEAFGENKGKEGDDDENPFKSVARELGKGLGEVLKPYIAKLNPELDPANDVTPPASRAAAAAEPTETGTDGNAPPAASTKKEGGTAMVKMFLASIRGAIKKNLEPAEYAVSLLQMVPPEYGADLEDALAGEGALEKIYGVAPDLRAHDTWMKAVAAEIVRQFDLNEQEANDAGGTTS